MNTFSKTALALSLALTVASCKNVEKEVNNYAERTVKLEAVSTDAASGAVNFAGKIPFVNRHSYTAYKTECDQQICGYDTRNVCTPVEHCSGSPTCTTTDVCRDVPDSVCHQNANGTESCTHTTRRVCTPVQHCSGGPVCHTTSVCRLEQFPRYCSVNCREVPYTAVDTQDRASAVSVKIKGIQTDAKDSGISQVFLAVRTNEQFRKDVADPANAPKDLQAVLKTLAKEDNTLLVVSAKNYMLVGGQTFLNLPTDFAAGKPVSIEVQVQSVSDKNAISALGTPVNFPALQTND